MPGPPRAPAEQPDQDLGFGGRVARESRSRFLNRDGSFNVVRHGLPFWRSLSLYQALISCSWPRYFAAAAGAYFATNLLFATAYFLCGRQALHGAEAEAPGARFAEAFFFSVQTLATIGYGRISPNGIVPNLLVAVEALFGLLGFALITGLLFARFSRPSARIAFSQNAVVAPYRGGRGLMLRIANQRRSQLLEVTATVSLSFYENLDGARVRRFHDLGLERRRVAFFPLHWVIVHPIDESSPISGMSPEAFVAADPELLVLLTAVDETFFQTVHARASYKAGEIVWGARFTDMFVASDDGRMAIDLGRLDAIEPAP